MRLLYTSHDIDEKRKVQGRIKDFCKGGFMLLWCTACGGGDGVCVCVGGGGGVFALPIVSHFS